MKGKDLRVENGANIVGRKNSVFCVIYSKNSQPYKGYKEVSDPNQVIPEIVMLMTWRAGFGLPGGTVDDEIEKFGFKQGLIETLKRELKEEIDFEIDENSLSDIICSHDLASGFVAHVFAYEVSEEEILNIRLNYTNVTHSRAEIAGLNLLPCASFGIHGLSTFLKHNLKFALRQEIVIAIKELGLISEDDLAIACKKASFNLNDLIS